MYSVLIFPQGKIDRKDSSVDLSDQGISERAG